MLKNQIETLHRLDDTILVTVVTGYKNHLVEQEIYKLRDIHPMIKTVYNTEAQNMGIVRSLELAATTIVEDAVLRLSGDLFFGPEADLHALIRHSEDALAVQRVPPSRNETVIIKNEVLVLTDVHSENDIEWLDIDYYANDSFKQVMNVSCWYIDGSQHYYQLMRHAIKIGSYRPKHIEVGGVFEIDTMEDLDYVRRKFAGGC